MNDIYSSLSSFVRGCCSFTAGKLRSRIISQTLFKIRSAEVIKAVLCLLGRVKKPSLAVVV